MSKVLSRMGLLAGMLVLPGATYSEVSFPQDACAVVVASRPDVAETRAWIEQNWTGPAPKVYLSDNGW